MLTRRILTMTIGATAALISPLGLNQSAFAQPAEQAVAFIKSTSDRLVVVVNSAASPAEKRVQLQQVVDATVDLDDIAHFCIGRFWRLAKPEEQQQYMALFHDLLATKIAGHLGEYRGVRVSMGLARASADT